ncbi:hypothetical protein [Absidia glauca]|uniref:F-box domain-containing protein n=1 Tax=Absidia glauca TaxID=4829 RepID=A0A163JJ40_ABSGL|nr:hypothetical protein [Absidia glauca]
MASGIGDLPHEVLCMIFGQLPHSDCSSLRMVNSTWDAILRVLVLQDLSICPDTISPILSTMERSLASNNPNVPMSHLVKNVYTQCSEGVSGPDLNHLARLCPNITTFHVNHHLLETLDLDDDDAFDCDQEPDTTHLASFFAALAPSLTTLVLQKAIPSSFVYKVALPHLVNLVELDFKHSGGRNSYLSLMRQNYMDFDDFMNFIQDSCPQLRSLAMNKGGRSMKEALLDMKRLQRQSVSEIQATLSTWSDNIRPWSALTSLRLDICVRNEPRDRDWGTVMLLYLAVKYAGLQHLGLNLRCSPISSAYGGARLMNLRPTDGDLNLCRALSSTLASSNDLCRQHVFSTLRSVSLNNIPLQHTTNIILFRHDSASMHFTQSSTRQSVSLYNNPLQHTTNINLFRHDSASMLFTRSSTVQPTPVPSSLKKLVLSNCFGGFIGSEGRNLLQSDFFQQRIFDRSLTSLTLNDGALDFPAVLRKIDPTTNLIAHLDLQICSSDYGSVPFDMVLDRFPRLKHLRLSNLWLSEQSTDLYRPPHPLEQLYIHQAVIVSSDLFWLVSDRCRDLTDLTLTNLNIVKTPLPVSCLEVTHGYFGKDVKSPLHQKNVTWIWMPHTHLSSLVISPHMDRNGHRYRYRHTSHVILPHSPELPPSLYCVKEHAGGDGQPQMQLCTSKLTDDILHGKAALRQSKSDLNHQDKSLHNLIRKNGLVALHFGKIKDLCFK